MRTRSKLGLLLVALVATGLVAVDAYVWAVEVGAVLVAVLAVDALDGRRAGGWQIGPHRRAVHVLLWVYVAVMLVGATWTYGAAPPGLWMQDAFGLTRNPWDRIGHLFQGALPAVVVLGLRPVPNCAMGSARAADAERTAGPAARSKGAPLHARTPAAAPARGFGLALLPGLALALAAGLAVAGVFEGLEAAFAHLAPAGVDFIDAQGDAQDRAWDLGFAGAGALLAVGVVHAARRSRAGT